jgi:hypothetical protein
MLSEGFFERPDISMELSSMEKAKLTAKWATTMTKWHIGFVTNGKRLGSAKVKPTRRWRSRKGD